MMKTQWEVKIISSDKPYNDLMNQIRSASKSMNIISGISAAITDVEIRTQCFALAKFGGAELSIYRNSRRRRSSKCKVKKINP